MQGISLSEREEIRQYLASTEFFRDLDEAAFSSVEAELEWVEIDTGDVLMRQGEVGDCLFVLLSGRLRAYIQRENGTEVAVGEISPGEAVGEMSIITDERRSATVRSLRPSTLVRLTRTGFNRLQTRHAEIMRLMAELVVRRLRQVNFASRPNNGKLTIGIFGGGEVALAPFVSRLVKALSRIDSTCHLSAAIVDTQMGQGFAESRTETPQNFKLSNWLSEQERRHRFVIYEATDPNPDSQWTRRVVEHADRLLVAVDGGAVPTSQVVARFAGRPEHRSEARRDLVLVHAGTKRPVSGTTRWMDAIPSDDRYHVWLDSSEDFERLARIIAGQAIGLVLGGGGARGFAHIGVIRALKEANVPIDFVGGTSTGALIAAQCALDWETSTMLDQNRRCFRMHPMHGDYTAPGVSATTPHKATRLFESLFGENLIEDQWRNYFSIACNLTRGEIVVSRRGRFRDRVEASTALPVLNSPVFDRGDALVDGAVINNLPADIMQRLCGGRVIAVDVSPRSDLGASTNEFRRIVRSGQKPPDSLPSIHSVVMRTVMLNSLISAESMRRYADVYMNPPVEEIEMFDWAAINEADQIGYRYAQRELQSIRHILPSER